MIIRETRAEFHKRTDDERGESDAVLSLELVRRVLDLPNEARTMMLAFFHSVDDGSVVVGDLQVEDGGVLSLRLFSGTAAPEDPPRDADNVVVLRR
jgi:hypothetical protein